MTALNDVKGLQDLKLKAVKKSVKSANHVPIAKTRNPVLSLQSSQATATPETGQHKKKKRFLSRSPLMDTELENQLKNRIADPYALLDFFKVYLASEPAVKLQLTGTCSTWTYQLDGIHTATHIRDQTGVFDK